MVEGRTLEICEDVEKIDEARLRAPTAAPVLPFANAGVACCDAPPARRVHRIASGRNVSVRCSCVGAKQQSGDFLKLHLENRTRAPALPRRV